MEQIATFSNLQVLFIVRSNFKLLEHFIFFFFFHSTSIWKLLGPIPEMRGNFTFLEDFLCIYI